MVGSSARDVPPFDRQAGDSPAPLTRIGDGALGAKAESLLLIHQRILPALPADGFPGFDVTVPAAVVLTTELYDAFLETNGLLDLDPPSMSDREVADAFLRGEIPAPYPDDLRAIVEQWRGPLVVRSSSLLEHELARPFAGVYGTKMLPNHQRDIDERADPLASAVKLVYASAFFKGARSFRARCGSEDRAEKLAVVIQEVSGRRMGNRFYPGVSGVARSHNYYPAGGASVHDGAVNLALGLGKTVVDGERSWTYSPASPHRPPPFRNVGDLLKACQSRFWAIDMREGTLAEPGRLTESLTRCNLDDAEADGMLRHVASTYDRQSDAVTPGTGNKGPRVLNFAPILHFGEIPLNDLLRELLARSQEVCGSEVEMEFTLDLDPEKGLPARLDFLQLRSMAVAQEPVDLQESDLASEDVLLSTHVVLGHGHLTDIQDVVFVKPTGFDPAHGRLLVAEVERFDRALRDSGRPYVLIGFGRWGTTDPWVGTPVRWSQICGARVIVEATLPQMKPELSQGSNFFHNLVTFGVLYLSVPHDEARPIDWDWLNGRETIANGDYVKHVRTDRPLRISVDGSSGRGVIKRGEA